MPIDVDPELGVLVDRRRRLILICRPILLRSTLARLTLIENYQSAFFEPVPARGAVGELWRVKRWE